ncbi:hypothetical protein ACPA9J_31630 [Pseudomonas aeruginosa]
MLNALLRRATPPPCRACLTRRVAAALAGAALGGSWISPSLFSAATTRHGRFPRRLPWPPALLIPGSSRPAPQPRHLETSAIATRRHGPGLAPAIPAALLATRALSLHPLRAAAAGLVGTGTALAGARPADPPRSVPKSSGRCCSSRRRA